MDMYTVLIVLVTDKQNTLVEFKVTPGILGIFIGVFCSTLYLSLKHIRMAAMSLSENASLIYVVNIPALLY